MGTREGRGDVDEEAEGFGVGDRVGEGETLTLSLLVGGWGSPCGGSTTGFGGGGGGIMIGSSAGGAGAGAGFLTIGDTDGELLGFIVGDGVDDAVFEGEGDWEAGGSSNAAGSRQLYEKKCVHPLRCGVDAKRA